MITGAHVLIYTSEPEAVRAAFRDVFGWRHVDDGDGWLIFALPPAELGVHPGETPHHQLSLMCDDIAATVAELRSKGIEFRGEPEAYGYGTGITMVLPGGAELQLYEPRHARPARHEPNVSRRPAAVKTGLRLVPSDPGPGGGRRKLPP